MRTSVRSAHPQRILLYGTLRPGHAHAYTKAHSPLYNEGSILHDIREGAHVGVCVMCVEGKETHREAQRRHNGPSTRHYLRACIALVLGICDIHICI